MTETFYHTKECYPATVTFREGIVVIYTTKRNEALAYDYSGGYNENLYKWFPKLIMVAGYVVGDYAREQTPGNQVRVTEVEPITDESERKELTDLLLKNEFRKRRIMVNFNFWDNTFT